MSPQDHNGLDQRARVMVQHRQGPVEAGAVAAAPPADGRARGAPPFFSGHRLNFDIALLLAQDGLTNGAIYALLALALVLVFAVTRVIFIPAGRVRRLRRADAGEPPARQGARHALAAARRAASIVTLVDTVGRAARGPAAAPAGDLRLEPVPAHAASSRRPGGSRRCSPPLWLQALLAARAGDPARPDALPPRLPAARQCVGAGAADRLGGGAFRAARLRAGVLRRRGLAHAGVHRRALPGRRGRGRRGQSLFVDRRVRGADRRVCICSSSGRCTARRCARPR